MADKIFELTHYTLIQKGNPMIYTSLAVLAMSTSAAVSSISNLVHLHPHAPEVDNRVSVVLYNKSFSFRDVKIDGHIYTIQHCHTLNVKAPAGTLIYSANRGQTSRVGDLLMELTPQIDHQRVELE